MNNIIKSLKFYCSRKAVTICAVMLASLLAMLTGLIVSKKTELFAAFGIISMCGISCLTAAILTAIYNERIQMYEIMSGYKPARIIFGRAAVCLSMALIFLTLTSVMCLIKSRSADMLERLILFWVMVIRSVLTVVFLSPLLKESSFGALLPMLLIMLCSSDLDAVARSPLSFFCYPQCFLLQGEITESFVIKVLASAVIVCGASYAVGFMTLKKKFDLEPKQIS